MPYIDFIWTLLTSSRSLCCDVEIRKAVCRMRRKRFLSRFYLRQLCALSVAVLAIFPEMSRADESGVSFWVPGLFGSLAAVPQTPGWSLGSIYYHTSVGASGSVAAAKEIQIGHFPATVNVNLNVNLNAQADLLLLVPPYTFATPVLGGQFAVSMMGVFGRNNVGIAGTLTAGAAGQCCQLAWEASQTRSQRSVTCIRRPR